MASKIRVLSDHTINKIAAGEVIENPSSVVKELVENSIDAGATDICIEIQGGGRQLIRISDNGCGMNRDDALLCLERHATSKIREVEEIHSLHTMGFRGEAIPSIASISKFTILTCPTNDSTLAPSQGTMVIVDGGKLLSCAPAARSQGTTMEVKSLFFNVPVRKKFLKSPAIDANEILKMTSLIALGYPDIKFQLITDGKSVLLTKVPQQKEFRDKLQERISDILGNDFVKNTTYIEKNNEHCHLRGVVGLTNYTRHNRTGQYVFINQRGISCPPIAYAVKDGYGTSLDAGRHPVFILHLTLPGDMVDVNVHPQKREVRLRQEHPLKELIVKAVQDALHHTSPSISPTTPIVSPVFANTLQKFPSEYPHQTQPWTFRPKFQPPVPSQAPAWPQSNENPPSKTFLSTTTPTLPNIAALPQKANTAPTFNYPLTPPKAIATLSGFILLDTSVQHEFIAKACPQASRGGLVLINQKRAHSRIIFEKLLKQDHTPVAQQALLIPQTIELPPFEADILRNSLQQLNKSGIHIQEFGPTTFLVDALPQIFGNSNIEILIKDLIHELRDTEEKNPQQESIRKIAQAASRSSLAYDRQLSLEQAQALINQLTRCDQPYQCPTGKPTMAQIPFDELAKLF